MTSRSPQGQGCYMDTFKA